MSSHSSGIPAKQSLPGFLPGPGDCVAGFGARPAASAAKGCEATALEKAVWVRLVVHSHRGLSCPTAADTARIDCLSGAGQLEITGDSVLQRNRVRNGQRRADSACRGAGRRNVTRTANRKADPSASFRTWQRRQSAGRKA